MIYGVNLGSSTLSLYGKLHRPKSLQEGPIGTITNVFGTTIIREKLSPFFCRITRVRIWNQEGREVFDHTSLLSKLLWTHLDEEICPKFDSRKSIFSKQHSIDFEHHQFSPLLQELYGQNITMEVSLSTSEGVSMYGVHAGNAQYFQVKPDYTPEGNFHLFTAIIDKHYNKTPVYFTVHCETGATNFMKGVVELDDFAHLCVGGVRVTERNVISNMNGKIVHAVAIPLQDWEDVYGDK